MKPTDNQELLQSKALNHFRTHIGVLQRLKAPWKYEQNFYGTLEHELAKKQAGPPPSALRADAAPKNDLENVYLIKAFWKMLPFRRSE